jgi:hypothetical protein
LAWDVYARYARQAVDDGVAYLIKRRSPDGFWRDYELPPGASESWVTSWVGWCLLQLPERADVRPEVASTARAVAAARTTAGWGYNHHTGADADSTAWALRLLTRVGANPGPGATELLGRYIDARGRAHTFPEAVDTWGAAHADVTPVVGLALLSTTPTPSLVRTVRSATLAARAPGGAWSSFWWTADSYATAWSLEFLAHSGGVPEGVSRDVRAWLTQPSGGATGIDLAYRLLACPRVGANSTVAARLVDELLDRSDGLNGFEPSAALLVPPRHDGVDSVAPGAHRDTNGFTTTSIACLALTRWISTT